MKDNSYQAVMARSNEIMKKAIGMDYNQFERGQLAFDYQAMMTEAGYSLEEVIAIQKETGVGNTPLYELKNITKLARMTAPKGKGARIFLKDEASNPSGSFKARRAALAVYHAAKHGYKGVVAGHQRQLWRCSGLPGRHPWPQEHNCPGGLRQQGRLPARNRRKRSGLRSLWR